MNLTAEYVTSEIDQSGKTLTLPALIKLFSGLQHVPVRRCGTWNGGTKGRKACLDPVLLAGDRRTVSRIGRKDHDRNISDRI